MSNIFALTQASGLKVQDSYVRGRVTGSNVITADDMKDFGINDYYGKQEESQVGMRPEGYVGQVVGRLKRLLTEAGVNQDNLTERDYQVIGNALLQQALTSGQMNRTVMDGRMTLVPRGDHLGDILGLQSDVLVGENLENAVQTNPGTMGLANTLSGSIPKNRGFNSPSGTGPNQPTVSTSKDVLGRMPFGMDADVMTTAYLQVSDILQKIVVGNTSLEATNINDQENLTHSTSEFAEAFKLDRATADADYRTKVIAARATENPQQSAQIAHDQNKITNTRMDELLKNLNKQLMLLKEGRFAEATKAFYYTFGNGDINGRIYNTTNNGNYTLDKQIARQTQKAKINPRINVDKASYEVQNKRINTAAKTLFNAEGNPKEFNRIVEGMEAKTEAEISFRIAQVMTILKDAKHARKELGKGRVTKHGEAAIAFANATGLAGLNNHSMQALYRGYLLVSGNNMALTRHFASHGAKIRASLNAINTQIMDLDIIAFDPKSNAKERSEQALSAWGDLKSENIDPLIAHVNSRGEMRQQLSIRDNALKFINAHDKVEIEGVISPSNFELDFEIELDAKQSGPMLQALIAPGITARDTTESLGYETDTERGDLRDKGKDILLSGSVTQKSWSGDLETGAAWQTLIEGALKGDKAGVARELLLKQTIMQYYYGKPASMFGDIAEEFLGYFDAEIKSNNTLKNLLPLDRVEGVKMIIEGMLSSEAFDNNYISTMKNLGRHLALTGSDLVIDGPMGPLNLTMESLQQAFIDGYNEDGTPSALQLDLIEIFDQNEEAFMVNVTNKTTNSYASKPTAYDQSVPTSGKNYPSSPGRRLADSIGVLIIHQLDNAAMNHTINVVNAKRDRNNPLPAKVIYDAVITNAAGLLKYSHAYNNESIPMIQKWNLGKALNRLMDNAASDFEQKIEGVESFNISVIEGQDGNLHGRDRYSVLTTWMDEYYDNMPKINDLKYRTAGEPNESLYNLDMAKHSSRGIENFVEMARKTDKGKKEGEARGYQPPRYNPDYLENGVVDKGALLVLNAAERSNMVLNNAEFELLFRIFTQRYTGNLKTFIADIDANKIIADRRGLTKIVHLGS